MGLGVAMTTRKSLLSSSDSLMEFVPLFQRFVYRALLVLLTATRQARQSDCRTGSHSGWKLQATTVPAAAAKGMTLKPYSMGIWLRSGRYHPVMPGTFTRGVRQR